VRALFPSLAFLLVWLAQLAPPRVIADDALDPSWSQAMGRLLLEGRLQGVDFLFTYGPLGLFASEVDEPALYWTRLLLWEGLWRASATLFLVLALGRLASFAERAGLLLLLVLLPLEFDAFAAAVCVAVTVALEREPAPPRALAFLGLATLAALALVKFTLAVMALACVLGLALSCAARREWGRAAALPGSFLGLGLGLWLLLGQRLSNALPWARSALALAASYAEAMSKDATALQAALGSAALALFLALLALRALSPSRSLPRAASGGGLALAAFLAFKAGYVRGDDHTPYFLGFAALAGLLLPVPAGSPAATRRRFGIARVALAAIGLAGIATAPAHEALGPGRLLASVGDRLVSNAAALLAPGRARERLDALRSERAARFDLPRIRERVGRDPVDVFSYHQGVAFLNDLAWSPRPLFQSYFAFTPELLERNARFYESDRAPRFVLFRLETIDERLPAMDDSRALEVLVRRYRPVLSEGRELLLERRSDPLPPPRRTLELEREIAFGEEIPLPAPAADGAARALALEIRTTLAGRLVQLLWRAPALWLEVRDELHRSWRWRIVPGMMRGGVLLDPLIAGHPGFVMWLTGAALPRVVSARLVPPAGFGWMYAPGVRARVERLAGLAPPPDPELQRALKAFVFERLPETLEAPRETLRVDHGGRDALFVFAPSAMSFALAPGPHRVEGLYGLVADPWGGPSSARALFRAALVEEAGPRVLWERWLERAPEAGPDEPQRLALDFQVERPARLVLATELAPDDAVRSAWCWWSEVRIDPRSR